MPVSKPLLTEFGIHHRLESCVKYNTISFSVCRTCITRVPDSCGGGWCPDPPAPHSLHYLLLQGGQVLLLQVQFWQRWPPATRQGGHKPSPVQWSKRKWVQATASWPGEVKITTTVYFLTNWICLVIMHLPYVYQPLLTTSWCALVTWMLFLWPKSNITTTSRCALDQFTP